jgi:hypothetical protein
MVPVRLVSRRLAYCTSFRPDRRRYNRKSEDGAAAACPRQPAASGCRGPMVSPAWGGGVGPRSDLQWSCAISGARRRAPFRSSRPPRHSPRPASAELRPRFQAGGQSQRVDLSARAPLMRSHLRRPCAEGASAPRLQLPTRRRAPVQRLPSMPLPGSPPVRRARAHLQGSSGAHWG